MEDIDHFEDIEVDDDFVDKDMVQIISDNEYDPLYDDCEGIAVALQLAGYGKVSYLEAKLAEKDKEIEDLKEWQNWYSMWHKKFKKNIEELQTELETYRPTKLKGNGQCVCYGCEQKGEFGRFWTDWCSKYKGHIYCDKCLKDLLEKEKENV